MIAVAPSCRICRTTADRSAPGSASRHRTGRTVSQRKSTRKRAVLRTTAIAVPITRSPMPTSTPPMLCTLDGARQTGRDDQADAAERDKTEGPQGRLEEVGPIRVRDEIDGVERRLRRLRDAETTPQRQADPDDQRGDVALQGSRLVLVADQRQLRERRVLDRTGQLRMPVQDEAQDRGERQQQREDGEERVVGDQRGQVAGLVLAELFDDRKRKAGPGSGALPGVEPAK